MSEATAAVMPLYGRMTEATYDAERARLRDVYGESGADAGAKFEQALASLFYRSNWTQEELAKKEGKSRSYLDKMLRFGRFLNFDPAGSNSKSLPKNLNEWQFRRFWGRTEGDERIRFREVLKLMQSATTITAPRRPKIGQAIKARYADGKWHKLDVIAGKIEGDADHIRETLDGMCKNQTYGVKAEKKKVGTHFEYRLFRMEKTIGSHELIEKLAPIVSDLENEGRKTQVTMSVITVAVLAAKLRKLLVEWAE